MKMKSSVWLLLALSAVLVFQRCSDDDEQRARQPFDAGVLVANEGGFQKANASVTFYDVDKDSATQNIFRNAAGEFAGDVLQSITISGDHAYLILNGSNAVEMVNAGTFDGEVTLTDKLIDKPQYMEVINGKAYISVWGPYDADYNLVDSYIVIADANTLTISDTIRTEEGISNLLYDGKYLFASNYYFGYGTSMSVIDPSKNEVVKNITVAGGPSGMVLDANKKLWLVSRGGYGAEDGYIYRINPTTFEIEFEHHVNGQPGFDLAVSPDGRKVFYTSANEIYSVALDATTGPETSLFTADDVQDLGALGVNPANGDIYVGDARAFATDGEVYIYSATGTLKTSFGAGVGPTQFIFKK